MRGRPRKRPLVQPSDVQLSPAGGHNLCTLQRAPTPSGSQRSPIVYKQELTPAEERRSARKRRRDRNRQSELLAVERTERAAKPTLSFAQRLLDTVDREQPELSFNMDVLERRLRTAEHGWRQDQRAAAGALRGGAEDAELMVRAAVHLLVGDRADQQWTPAGRERVACGVCQRAFAANRHGVARKHVCAPVIACQVK
uniref:Uncharacterized protein n=1 Tax=Prymnesium polylepis TaxID=72548 RepID=A0A7S4HCN1_9EUKA